MIDALREDPTRLSLRTRLLFVLSTAIIYISILLAIYPLFERSSLIIAFIPVIILAYLFGRKGGLIFSLLVIPTNTIFIMLVEQSTLNDFISTNYWANYIVLILVGLTVGYMQELRQRLLSELVQSERNKQELYLSEQRYRALFQQSNDAIFISTINGNYLETNDAAADMIGYSTDEMTSLSASQIAAPSEHSKIDNIRHMLLEGEPLPTYERILLKKDGTTFLAEVNVVLVRDEAGDLLHVQSIVRDISERKHTLNQLEQSEIRYRALFQQSNDAVFITGLDGRYLEVNQVAANLLGYTVDELVKLSNKDIVSPVEHSGSENVRERLLQGEKLPVYERILHKKNGEPLIVELNVSLVRDEAGNPHHIQSIARDISERKQTLNQLTQSEIRYRSLFEQSHYAVFILDLDGNHIESNYAASKMLGYTLDEIANRSIWDAVVPSQHSMSENVIERLLEGEVFPMYERTFRKKDGTHFPVELNIILIRDEAGKPLHIQSLVRDISERKQTLNQIKQSELRYRSLFKQSNDAVFILDPNGIHLEANQAATEMLGYTPDELKNLSFREIVVPTEHSKTESVIEKLLAGEHFPIYERLFRKKDGTVLPVEVNVALVSDEAGNPLHIQSITRDISERRETLNLLQQSETRYRSLFQQSNDAVFIVGLDGTYLETNDAAEEMLGYMPGEIVNLSTLEIIAPTEHSKTENVIERLLAGERLPIYERLFCKKNGVIFPVEINVALVFDEAGNPLHIQSIARDISARKKAQDQELNYALEVQKTQLLAKLIKGLSHDLKTPLSIIKTNLYLLEKLKEPEQQSGRLDIIEKQVDHLEEVFQDILTISRLEGLSTPSFRVLKLDRLAREIATKYHTITQEKSISFDLKLEDNLPTVLGDKGTLYLALEELVENALSYTSEGGRIIFQIYVEAEYVILSLEDTGEGIREEDIPYVFDYFFRGDYARSLVTGGAGLGLSIAKKAVEIHGGFLEVKSTLGQGTTFRIRLPRLDKIGNP